MEKGKDRKSQKPGVLCVCGRYTTSDRYPAGDLPAIWVALEAWLPEINLRNIDLAWRI